MGSCASVLKGKVDVIILTGGKAFDRRFVAKIKDLVGFILPVMVYPGENEMIALVKEALRVLRQQEKVKEYKIYQFCDIRIADYQLKKRSM